MQVKAAQPGTRAVHRYVIALLWIGAAVVCILPPYLGGDFYSAATLMLCVIATGWYYGKVPGQLSAIGSSLAFGFYVYRHDILLHAILHSVVFCVLSGMIGRSLGDERKKMMRLCTENQQLKRMVDLSPVGMALLGLDRKLMRSNPALRRMFGLSDDQDGNSYLPLPESKREEWEKLGKGLRRGESFTNVETLRTRSDGSKFYAHISATPLFDDSGELDGLVGVIADTSAIHRRYLERYVLESLVHRSIDFICVADLKQNVLFINDVGQKLVGLLEEEVIATLKFSDLFTGQNRDVLRDTILPRLVDGDADVQFRLELRHFAGGEPVRALCNLFSIHDPVSDEPVCIGCVAHLAGKAATDDRDETAPVQILSKKVPFGIALLDITGRPFDCNEQFGQILGYSVDEVKQMTFCSFVHPEDLPSGKSRFLELTSGKLDHYQGTKRLVSKNGVIIGARTNMNLIRTLAGQPNYCISTIHRLPE